MRKLMLALCLILVGCSSNGERNSVSKHDLSIEEIVFSDYLPEVEMYRPMLMDDDFIYVATSNYKFEGYKAGPYYDTGFYKINLETKEIVKLIDFNDEKNNVIIRVEFDKDGIVYVEKYKDVNEVAYDRISVDLTIFKIDGNTVTNLLESSVSDVSLNYKLSKLYDKVFIERFSSKTESYIFTSRIDVFVPQDLVNPIYTYISDDNESLQGSIENEICSRTFNNEILKCNIYSYQDEKIEAKEIPINLYTTQMIDRDNRILRQSNTDMVVNALFSFSSNKITPIGRFLPYSEQLSLMVMNPFVFNNQSLIYQNESELNILTLENLESTPIDNVELKNVLEQSVVGKFDAGYILLTKNIDTEKDSAFTGGYLTLSGTEPVLTSIEFPIQNFEGLGKFDTEISVVSQGDKGIIHIVYNRYSLVNDQSTYEFYQKFYIIK